MTLRTRIILTLTPLLLLAAALGISGVALLGRLGGRVELILRENYDSVVAMQRLNEALERMDSAFQFSLLGRDDAERQYRAHRPAFDEAVDIEARNVTLPGERELSDRLQHLRRDYFRDGEAFWKRPDAERKSAYFGTAGHPGLLDRFKDIKGVSLSIREMNQQNMEDAADDARRTASSSLWWLAGGLAAAAVAAALAAGWTVRSVLQPISQITRSAQAIGAGELDQVVPVLSDDELGRLADAFNGMAGKLRQYRQSQTAKLVRAQRVGQATIDSFPDPVVVLDPAGRVEASNPAAGRLLGLSSQHGPPGWTPPEPLSRPLQEALVGQRDYLPDGFEAVLPLKVGAGGEERFFLPRILSIRDDDGAALGAAVLLQDVTRLRLLDRLKSDLVSTASHELKTPLTSLRMVVHLLLEEAVGPLTPKQTELLVDARDNAERLLATINNLLSLTRLETGRELLDLRPTPPAELLRTAADDIRPRAEEKSVSLAVEAADDLGEVSVDPIRFPVALRNLLDNAVTYTDPGGQVTLSAGRDGDRVVLSVADTGIGIPPEDVPRIFDRFFRVPGRTRGAGTGLGLAITHEIVAVHGGSITCESRVGEGTTFRISLPAKEGAPQ